MTESDNNDEVLEIDLSDSIINDFLLVISAIMTLISAALIVSNTARLLNRNMFKILIFLFYLNVFLAVLVFITLYSVMYYYSFVQDPEFENSGTELLLFHIFFMATNFTQYYFLAATTLTMY